MRNLFRYFTRNHVFFLFLFLEVISMVFLFNYNNYQKVRFINSSNWVAASIYKTYSSVVDYFNLSKINEELAEENAAIRNRLNQVLPAKLVSAEQNDSLKKEQDFVYTSARVINNSVYHQYNYITLDKGQKDNIEPDRGVISDKGVIGIVTNTSNSYSVGMSLLNQKINISAKLKKNNYIGSVTWDSKDYRFVQLKEIPFHVNIAKGDTVVTSGYSSFFPEGVPIGTVHSYEKTGGDNFYSISVELAVDFKTISYVHIIENLDSEEIKALEKMSGTDEDLD